MSALLLELFSEEIPSRMQRGAAEQLQKLVTEGLKKHMLTPAGCKTFVSPRHLAIAVKGLPAVQPDLREERRGPKIGAPEQALKGFLQSTGLKLEQCEQRDGYYYALIERKGRAVSEVVKEVGEAALAAFVWPKSMRWGARPLNWVRPLHRIVCLLDDTVVPIQFAHLIASNITEGHRFLSPAPITIPHAEKYEDLLKAAHVLVDFEVRRAKIKTEIEALAAKNTLRVIDDEALLNEVTGLVEWPVPLLCRFDAKFLDLPREVLISEMKNHQRYFALTDAAGNLSTQFITIANMVNADGGSRVIAGNERVVRARLSDGEFYWDQDRKTKLEDWGKKLSDVVFHAKVGMMDAKVARIEALALRIKQECFVTVDEAHLKLAAKLCKADLTSGMVGEFPELQGIMGWYYAREEKLPKAIQDAIRDHYVPQGATKQDEESLRKQSEISAVISIADKLDSIISLFATGEKPTGSKDPLALRRAALGVLRILQQQQRNLDIAAFAPSEVVDFFRERLKQLLRDNKIRHDIIEGVLSSNTEGFVPYMLTVQAHNFNEWAPTESGKASIAAIKRTLNILAAEEKKAKTTFAAKLSDALVLPAEKQLTEALKISIKEPKDLEVLTAPINAFFDAVLVTEEGKKEARLGLLAAVREATSKIADFSKIEG